LSGWIPSLSGWIPSLSGWIPSFKPIKLFINNTLHALNLRELIEQEGATRFFVKI
jgi:hypothetical protein